MLVPATRVDEVRSEPQDQLRFGPSFDTPRVTLTDLHSEIQIDAEAHPSGSGYFVTSIAVLAHAGSNTHVATYTLGPNLDQARRAELASLLLGEHGPRCPQDALEVLRLLPSNRYSWGPPVSFQSLSPNGSSAQVFYRIPSFVDYAKDPTLIERSISTRGADAFGVVVQLDCTLHPRSGEIIVQFIDRPDSVNRVPGPPITLAPFENGSASLEQLNIFAYSMFERLWSDGSDAAVRYCRTLAQDQLEVPNIACFLPRDDETLILDGHVVPHLVEKRVELGSGAEIFLTVGSKHSSILARAQPFDGAATMWWVLPWRAEQFAKNPAIYRSMTGLLNNLSLGNSALALSGIKYLDGIAPKPKWRPMSDLEGLVGEECAAALTSIPNIEVGCCPPSTDAQRLEVLDGFQHIKIAARGSNRLRYPGKAFQMLVVACGTENFRIEATDRLRNTLTCELVGNSYQPLEGLAQHLPSLTHAVRLFAGQEIHGSTLLQLYLEELGAETGQGPLTIPLSTDHPRFQNYWALMELVHAIHVLDPQIVDSEKIGSLRRSLQVNLLPNNKYSCSIEINHFRMQLTVDEGGVSSIDFSQCYGGKEIITNFERSTFSAHPPSNRWMYRVLVDLFCRWAREQENLPRAAVTSSLATSSLDSHLRMYFHARNLIREIDS